MKTLQETFDTVARHLLTQKERCAIPDPRNTDAIICQLRDPEGRKCAIGVLIPDELYRPEMEGKSVSALAREYKELAEVFEITIVPQAGIVDPREQLLDQLTEIHDSFMPELWASCLETTAREFNLDFGVIRELCPARYN